VSDGFRPTMGAPYAPAAKILGLAAGWLRSLAAWGCFLSVCNGLRAFGSFRRFEGSAEDALFFAGVFEAGGYRA
jgi:hypothetical protein